jgi:hypothetical protein
MRPSHDRMRRQAEAGGVMVKYCGSIKTWDMSDPSKPHGWMYGTHILSDDDTSTECPICHIPLNQPESPHEPG